MNHRIKLGLAGLATAAALFAAQSATAKQLTVWCWDPNFNVAIMKEAGARYTKTHPDVTFNVVDFAKADVEQKLQTALSSGVKESLPDIVLIEDYSAQKYLQSFPDAFAPMSGIVDYSTFAPYKVQAMTVGDKVYGMPFDSGVTGLFYRKDYFAAAGYTAADMQNLTWDKFLDMGKQVEAKTGKKLMGLDTTNAGLFRIIMQSAGQWYFDKEGHPTIENNDALTAAVGVQARILKEGLYKPASSWTDWVATFTSGDVATVLSGVWITGTIKAQTDQAGKWGVAAIPTINVKGAVNASNLGGSSWYVLASSPGKTEAIDFLNQIYGKDIDFYQSILQSRGAVGTLLAARGGPAYAAPDAFFNNDKIWLTFSDWLGKVPAVNYGVYTNEVDAAILAQMPAIGNGTPAAQVLKAVSDQVKTQIQ